MFRSVATLGASLFVLLAISFLFAPDLVTSAWGLSLKGDAAFIGQRLGAGFTGFAVMLFLARDAQPSVGRRALAFGVAAALLVVAGVGVLGMIQGTVGGGILLAIAVEVPLAGALIWAGQSTG